MYGTDGPKRTISINSETTAVFSAVRLDQDQVSIIVDKTGLNTVAIDIELTHIGTGSFDAAGTLKVIAGNNEDLTDDDALAVPTWTVAAAGKLKFQLTTGYTHIGLSFVHSSGGERDEIDGTIAVSS